MITERDVRDKLAKLETLGTPDAIALEMEALGITARRKCASTCVVAQYLGNSPDAGWSYGDRDVAVGRVDLSLWQGDKPVISINLPEVVREFIHRFDDGAYPALDNGHQPGAGGAA